MLDCCQTISDKQEGIGVLWAKTTVKAVDYGAPRGHCIRYVEVARCNRGREGKNQARRKICSSDEYFNA